MKVSPKIITNINTIRQQQTTTTASPSPAKNGATSNGKKRSAMPQEVDLTDSIVNKKKTVEPAPKR